MRLLVPLVVGVASWVSIPSAARGEEPPGRWRVAVEGTTELPLSMGGRLTFETPGRIRLAAGLGVMPLPYVASLDQVLRAAGAYDPTFSVAFSDMITGSLVTRGQIGWRPWYDRGWYFAGGYSSVALGSGTSLLRPLSGLLRKVPPELRKWVDEHAPDYVDGARMPSYALSATLHLVTLEVGHQWVAFDRLVVRWAIGFAGTFAADVVIEPEAKGYTDDDVVAKYARKAEARLHDILTSYGFMPVISFGVGYRFEGPEAVDD